MTTPSKLGAATRYAFRCICLTLALSMGSAQEAPKGNAETNPPSATRIITTDRQKWTALRDAKRLSQKAYVFEKQGKANEAEQTAQEALALEEQVRGPWHIEVARRLDQLADLYTAHKNDRAAEPLYERATAIRERALSTHPDIYEREGGDLRPKRNQPAEKAAPVKPRP